LILTINVPLYKTMSSNLLIQAYRIYYKGKMKHKEYENKCFYDYVRRQRKYKKQFSNETFGMVCRICYQLGEPVHNWIITNGKI